MESGNFEWLKESEKVVLASRVQPPVSSINLKLDISNRCLADPNKQSNDFISKIHDLQLYNKRTGDDGKSERYGLPPSLSPSPPLSDAKRPLRRREEHGIRNKCPEKASISVSLLCIDINLLFISSCYTRTSFTDPSAKYELTDGGSFHEIFLWPPLYPQKQKKTKSCPPCHERLAFDHIYCSVCIAHASQLFYRPHG